MPFEFYISDKMKNVKSGLYKSIMYDGQIDDISTENIINICLTHYYAALEAGVKPEEARRIIPQACYTTAWFAMQLKQLDNFFKLRLDKTAQREIQQIAQAMSSLIHTEN